MKRACAQLQVAVREPHCCTLGADFPSTVPEAGAIIHAPMPSVFTCLWMEAFLAAGLSWQRCAVPLQAVGPSRTCRSWLVVLSSNSNVVGVPSNYEFGVRSARLLLSAPKITSGACLEREYHRVDQMRVPKSNGPKDSNSCC